MLSLCLRLIALCSIVAICSVAAFAQVSVTTQRYDTGRTGQNLNETVLNTSNVNVNTFGKLFTRAVDDEVYAQPLYVPNVTIPGVGSRNVLFVATVNNSVYAFDADDPSSPLPFWRVNFNGSFHATNNTEVGQACGTYRDFSGNLGLVGTPVIDPATSTMYFVTKTTENATFVQRLHAINITTGAEKSGSPVVVTATVAGTGDGQVGGQITFNPRTANQRGSLALVNGTVYITWASHCDTSPYHGWIMGFNATTLARQFAVAVTPNGSAGGIWQSGTGPSFDPSGAFFVTVGNGSVSAPSGGSDYGNAFLKVSAAGAITDWFIPFNYQNLNSGDTDLGSGGVLIVPNTNLMISGGKEGKIYLVDRTNLGHFHAGSDTQIVQSFQVAPAGRHVHGCPTYWNGPGGPWIYVWCEADHGKAFKLTSGLLPTTPTKQTTMVANDGMPGGMLSISANGNAAGSGILWSALALNGDANQDVRPGILRAFDASDISQEIWNSLQNPTRDDFGNFAKYNTPIVVSGKLYLGTFSKQVVVYGLLPANDQRPTVSAGNDVTIALPNAATLSGTASDDGIPGPLTTTWILVSGPGTVTVANPHALTTTATFSAPGTYTFRLTASDGALAADAMMQVNVLSAGAIIGTGTGIKGEYWDNQDFTGALLTRVDPTIFFDWGQASPDPSMGANTFSVRWTGQVQAQFSETYTFTTTSDDGVRLWVNNQMLVDNWTNHGATENNGTVSLVKGQRYDIKMEYYESTGDAVAKLAWASASTPKSTIPQVQYFPQAPPTTGNSTIGVYVPSTAAWFTKNANAPGGADNTYIYGPSGLGWIPVSGDWDGNGTDTPGVYDPSTSSFFLKNTPGPGAADIVVTFGAAGQGYVPIVGDWDGNGTDTIGVYNPANGAFFLRNSNTPGGADLTFFYGPGGAGVFPLAGDWDGDGKDSVGIYNAATAAFFLHNSNSSGNAEWAFNYGPANATPVVGDWNNDGIDSIGIYVPASATFFLKNTNTFGVADLAFGYGPSNARPIIGNWDGH